jgi:hypothetical protein
MALICHIAYIKIAGGKMGRGETGQTIKLCMDCNKFYSMSTAGNGKRAYDIYLVQRTGRMLQVGIFFSPLIAKKRLA